MRKRSFWFLYLFLFFFLLLFFSSKFFGDGYIGKIGSPSPLTWKESISNIPGYAVLSLIFTLLIYFLQRAQSKKDTEKKS